MDELDALSGAGEDHLVLADHVASAQGGKSDIARAAGTDVALAHAHAVILERDGPARSRGLAEEGCAGGGVALMAVMQLEDLDVEIRAERLATLLVSPASRLTPRLILPALTIARGGRRLRSWPGPRQRARSCRTDDARLRGDAGKATVAFGVVKSSTPCTSAKTGVDRR